jgi:hypothetical protein
VREWPALDGNVGFGGTRRTGKGRPRKNATGVKRDRLFCRKGLLCGAGRREGPVSVTSTSDEEHFQFCDYVGDYVIRGTPGQDGSACVPIEAVDLVR